MNFFRDKAILFHALAVGFLLLAFSPGRLLSWDVSVRQSISRSLWTEGTVFVDKSHHRAEGMVKGQGGYTSFYGIGQTLALIPFDMVGYAMRGLAGGNEERGNLLDQMPVVWLYIPLMGLLFWALSNWCLFQFGVPLRKAVWASSAFMGSTILWVYASQSAQEEMLVGALFLGSMGLMLSWKTNPIPQKAFFCGLLAASAPLVRLNSALGLIILGGLFYHVLRERWDHPKRNAGVIAGVVGGLVPFALYCGFAYWRFGSVFASGYDQTGSDHMGVIWGAVNPTVLFGVLFGPGKGMIPLSPPLLIAFLGVWALRKKQPVFSLSFLVALLVSTVIISRVTNNPDGSESWGSRYQVHLLAFLIYPFWEGWKLCLKSVPGRAFAAVLLVAGIGIQVFGTLMPNSIEYIQSDVEGHHRYDMITGAASGQLGRRMGNVLGEGDRVPAGTPAAKAENLTYMRDTYFPNYWGPSYSQKTGSAIPVMLWALLAFSGLGFLIVAYKISSSPLPQGGKFH